MTPTTLYRNGRIYSPADPAATALLVADGRIAWLGADGDAPTADHTVELAGAVVTPAFVDAHVHTTNTGIALLGLDLSGAGSPVQLLNAVAAHADSLPAAAVVVGHGWDESGWTDQSPPGAAELARAGGGRRVYLSQACMHSALVSAGLLAEVAEDTAGYDAAGWLRRDAHHRARGIALGSLTRQQRRQAQRAALRRAASVGIAAVHECGGPGTSAEDDFAELVAGSGGADLPAVYGYWGELGAAAKARELGAVGAGGDLFADGALGSRTAHLRVPYVDDPASRGFGYLAAHEVTAHVVDCVRVGVQAGFHAIGDAAIATVLEGFAGAAAVVGVERLRAGRHRIEHLEILDRALIRGLVEYGVTASLQPAFDRLWGGEAGMYAQRLGVERSLASNPIGALAGVGVALAFGSDSPVTPLDPWGTVRAAMSHHNPTYRINAKTAFAAHTRGGWRAVAGDVARSAHAGPAPATYGQDGQAGMRVERDGPGGREPWSMAGVLAPGAPATFAVWDVPGGLAGALPALLPAGPDEPVPAPPVCRRTVLRGAVIYDVEGQ